jgi:DHA2 family multidrug resistance protein
VINQILLQQAQLWAYVDNFRALALLCLLCIPLVLLFRRVCTNPTSAIH